MSRPVGIPYAGSPLDRAVDRRRDAQWLATAIGDPQACVRVFWGDECLVAGMPALPVALGPSLAYGDSPGRRELVFLGLSDGTPQLALDLSEIALDDALAATGASGAADLRALYPDLTATQAATLAYARGMLRWHRHQRFCGRCGAATEARDGGHQRACTDEACGTLLFPRIEPAVITLVETSAAPRRCLLARHRTSTTGGYSLLAGFVEIGESLEDAVRREIAEETSVHLDEVRYFASQPWPFPSGLMVGFRAIAHDESLLVDGEEIAEARWFTRGELRAYAESTGRLGRVDSIDRVMLTRWLAEGDSLQTG